MYDVHSILNNDTNNDVTFYAIFYCGHKIVSFSCSVLDVFSCIPYTYLSMIIKKKVVLFNIQDGN
jgi:hypothetical protein